MYIKVLLEATPGENIEYFADEVVNYSKAIQRNVVAVFNETYITVKHTMTVKEFLHKYWSVKNGNL